jgi:hypothetical protein
MDYERNLDMRILTIALVGSLALLAPFYSVSAHADGKCSDCQAQYSAQSAGCGDPSMNTEAQNLCITIASSNLDACNSTCSLRDSTDDHDIIDNTQP